ncbi:uncharacterized protein LOC108485182 [Gossypium arboreum]|uniref:uncharacterized protein LOC108485182 n=1 Tax=Gossypium arboreum TaxID=29729 RepID=UPI0008194305|nr:uncharacterized protein LOC108485182 [Gossypium arboreum]
MQQIKDSWQDFGYESNEEETLSLCDLAMNGDDHSNQFWNDDEYLRNQQSNTNGDLFEFFSDDFPAPASIFPENSNNVIFCGKVISYREDQPNVGNKSQRLKCKIKQENNEKKKDFGCLFPWKISSGRPFNKSRTFPSSKSTKESRIRKGFFNKSCSMPASVSKNKFGVENERFNNEKFNFSLKKESMLATPVKSRWYLFAFGVGRFPMEIELKDMKMRQSRRYKSMKVQSPVSGRDCGRRSERRSGKGLWRLLKVLGWK